jgi:hypothetical protein
VKGSHHDATAVPRTNLRVHLRTARDRTVAGTGAAKLSSRMGHTASDIHLFLTAALPEEVMIGGDDRGRAQRHAGASTPWSAAAERRPRDPGR